VSRIIVYFFNETTPNLYGVTFTSNFSEHPHNIKLTKSTFVTFEGEIFGAYYLVNLIWTEQLVLALDDQPITSHQLSQYGLDDVVD